jgi:hypothetical protein
MQIIRANHLPVKKESWKENLCRHQEEGGSKNITSVGDRAKCPECKRMGYIVWVSKDGKTEGIQCPASHRQRNRPDSRFGTLNRPQSKNSRNMVFITETI